MIRSFRDKETEKIFDREYSKRFPQVVQSMMYRKLLLLHAAIDLNDLRIPPGNRLEKLKGNRDGQYSIRINDQWRICFIWDHGQVIHVEIVDYH